MALRSSSRSATVRRSAASRLIHSGVVYASAPTARISWLRSSSLISGSAGAERLESLARMAAAELSVGAYCEATG
jgi:hypothetical protein